MTPEGVNVQHPDKLYINGEWVAPLEGGSIEIENPASEEIVARVAEAGDADMDRAVAAARAAFDHGPWPRTSPAERMAKLMQVVDLLEPRVPEIAAAWTAQVGGLATAAMPMHGGAVMGLRGVASLGERFAFQEQRKGAIVDTVVLAYEPVGVVVAIAPWNAPFAIMASKVFNALIAGCTVIMKPSPETPLETYILMEAIAAAGLPAGVVNLVPSHREAADHLIHSTGIDKVTFTGSSAAGCHIASVCGSNMVRATFELGGKSAAIICDDFPTEAAAQILGNTINVMSGQVCAMLTRAIVPKARHDELAEAIAKVMQGTKIGDPNDPTTQLGPVAMRRQRDRIEMYIEEGKKSGATLVTGGGRPAHLNKGYYIEPTLFANVDNNSRIAQEEIFGPVLCLIPAEDEADAIRIANESEFGLNGSVFTNDPQKAYDVARQVRTGAVAQNGMKLEFTAPFGGFKKSGIGREGGDHAIYNFLELKTILLDAPVSV